MFKLSVIWLVTINTIATVLALLGVGVAQAALVFEFMVILFGLTVMAFAFVVHKLINA